MHMESKFIPTLQVGNGYTYLKLKGILDEDNLLANLLSQIQGRLLLIDMAEIERINSCGVRDWVNWLNQIQALGIAVILLRCSPSVVSQANMVTNFAADSFIHSFYAPYVHPDTGDEQSVLLFTEEIRQNLPVRAPKIFNEQGEELEFDEFEESYFAFISDPRILNYQVSPEVQAVIQYYLPEAATRQPVIGGRTSPSVASAQASTPYGGQGMSGYGNGMSNAMSGYNNSMPQGGARDNVRGMNPAALGQSNAYGASIGASMPMNPDMAPQNSYGQSMGSAGYGQQQAYGQPYMAPQNSYGQAAGYAQQGNLPSSSGGNRVGNAYGMPQKASQQPYGIDESAMTSAYKAPQNMPQPAQSMMRHEQPPLPSTENAQQVASRPKPSAPQNMPSNGIPSAPPCNVPSAPPKPAPQPVSPLAQQSMARQSIASQVPSPTASSNGIAPEGSSQNVQPQYPVSRYAQRMNGIDATKRKILLIAGGAALVLFVILILVLAL